jgi:hypothetical protein
MITDNSASSDPACATKFGLGQIDCVERDPLAKFVDTRASICGCSFLGTQTPDTYIELSRMPLMFYCDISQIR